MFLCGLPAVKCIDDSLNLPSHSRYFTTLDLATGFWQVKMAPDAFEKTAFATHSGLFELCNAPVTFQRLMEDVLAGLTRDMYRLYRRHYGDGSHI